MSFQLTATDAKNSVLLTLSGGTVRRAGFTPWGGGGPSALATIPGFNGERQDPAGTHYHLGNGYRAYSPTLMRFTCPDSLSPFGAGGINPYAYCDGDPVNLADPSGHMSAQAGVGIALGVFGIVLAIFTAGASVAAAGSVMAALAGADAATLIAGAAGVTADVLGIASASLEETDPQAAAALGWASLATGIVSAGAGGMGYAQSKSRSKAPQATAGKNANWDAQTFFTLETVTDGESKLTVGGYTNNYRGKGEPAILTHGTYTRAEGPKLIYASGFGSVEQYKNGSFGQVRAPFDFVEQATPERFVDLLRERNNIDLRAVGGNTGTAPLRLLACHATKGGRNSAAKRLAKATGRVVYAYSDYRISTRDSVAAIDGNPSAIVSGPSGGWRGTALIFRNLLRGRAPEFSGQLNKKTFSP